MSARAARESVAARIYWVGDINASRLEWAQFFRLTSRYWRRVAVTRPRQYRRFREWVKRGAEIAGELRRAKAIEARKLGERNT